MSNVPVDLRYARTHEWVRQLADGRFEIGITDHAQHALGDLVFVELPEVGRTLEAGTACAVVESVKAASDVYAPLNGTVVERNDELAAAPELINQDSYGRGWMVRVQAAAGTALDGLLTADAYAAVIAAEGG